MNRNCFDFDQKYPGKRHKIHVLLTKELKRVKQIGFPNHHVSNMSGALTKHIINILMED